jgi:preprotein translocase subunit SecF
MEILRNANFDFMRYRRFFAVVSAVLIAAILVLDVIGSRLNLGIDFAGGTQLTVRFVEAPEVDELRSLMESSGIEDVVIQRFGEPGDHSVIFKTPLAEGVEEGSRARIVQALRERNDGGSGKLDLNERGVQALSAKLLELDPDQLRALDEAQAAAHYERMAAAVGDVKKQVGILTSWDQVATAPALGAEQGGSAALAVSAEALDALRREAELGSFTVLGAENVGPQIGSELRRNGMQAVVLAMIGMLMYIWLRFELRYGMGALVAIVHDVILTLGLFALAGLEFNLTTIAGFLTLVGYSVNDSVVIFDRVRENLRQNRRGSLADVMNKSINQTLSRTVLTSSTTLLVVGSLLLLGGDVLRGFAFILTIGVVVGTYSSVYIASPFALVWERWFGAEARSKRRAR